MVAAFQLLLVQFHPQDKSQELLHEETLRQFNNFYAYRRSRLYSVTSGIPAVLWYTIALGALINIVLIWLFDLRLRPHLILGGLVSFYPATVISVIALLDHPFRGDLGVSSEDETVDKNRPADRPRQRKEGRRWRNFEA